MVAISASRLIYALCLLAPWSMLWLDSSLLFPYETGKAWVFRSIVELGFALLVYQWLVAYRVSNIKLGWLATLLLAFLLWSLFTDLAGVDAYRSFWSNYERMAGWVSYLHWAMYLLCLSAVLTPGRATLLLVNLGFVISIICLLGLFEEEKRIISSLGNPIYLGNLAVLGIFLCGFLASGKSGRWQRRTRFMLAMPIVAIMGLALLNAASRGPMIALMLGLICIVMLILFGAIDGFKWRSKIVVLCGLILGASLLISQFDTIQQVLKQSDSYALQRIGHISLQDQTTADRLMNWRIALSAAQQQPWFGWGQQNYAIAFTEHYQAGVMDQADIWFDRAHNAYLDVLVASGIPGLVLYILMLSLPILLALNIRQWSGWQKAFAVAFLVAFITKNLVGLDTFAANLLWISFIAVLLQQQQGQHRPDSPALKLSLLLPILALTFFLISHFNIVPYLDNRQLSMAVKQPEMLANKEFENWFEQIKSGPRYGQNARLAVFDKLLVSKRKSGLGEIEVKNREQLFQQAGVLISTELERQPRNYRIRYNGGLLLARLGHYALAVKQFERLTRDAPERTVFWHALAQIYTASGDQNAAAKARAKALQLNPKWGS